MKTFLVQVPKIISIPSDSFKMHVIWNLIFSDNYVWDRTFTDKKDGYLLHVENNEILALLKYHISDTFKISNNCLHYYVSMLKSIYSVLIK